MRKGLIRSLASRAFSPRAIALIALRPLRLLFQKIVTFPTTMRPSSFPPPIILTLFPLAPSSRGFLMPVNYSPQFTCPTAFRR